MSDTAAPIRGAVGMGIAPSLRRAAPFCIVVFCVARVATSLAGVTFVRDHPPDPSAVTRMSPPPPYTAPATTGWHNAIDGMQRWDAAWFTWIAADGYGNDHDTSTDTRIAFFPAYPAAVALVSATGLDTLDSAVVVSNIAYVAALMVLFMLTCVEFGERDARWATVFFASMPTSFFFLAPYSESLFLLATLAAFLGARRSRWAATAGVGFVAGLTRPLAIALVPALWLVRPATGGGSRRLRVTAVVAPAIGVASFLTWWGLTRGDPLAPMHAQAYWGRDLSFPPVTVIQGSVFAILAALRGIHPYLVVDGALVALGLVSAVLAIRRVPREYVAYLWTSLLIPLSFAWPDRPFLSIPRFVGVLFPVAWTWVRILRTGPRLVVAIVLIALFQLSLATIFMNWGWLF
jgi:hypothetical protein